MKICMICPEMGNSGGNAFIGGHVNNVVQISRELFNRGHEITIITTPHRYPGNHPDKDFLRGWAEVFTLTTTGSYLSVRYGLEFAFEAIRKVKEIGKYRKFDVVHGHSGYSTLALITSVSAGTSNLPSIHSIYSPIQVAGRNAVKFFSNKTISKLYFSRVDKIIAVTRNVRYSLLRAGIPKSKVEVIPLGIDRRLYGPSLSYQNVRKRYGILPEQPTLMYVGNLTNQKGLSVLIDALNIVKKRFHDIKFLMVLNMPLENHEKPDKLDVDMKEIFRIKEKIKRYGLEDNIVPLGLLNDMPQVIATSDVFVTPFLDTVGIVDCPTSLLEAMAVGKPVVATRVGGIPEIIEHGKNGVLVEPNNVDELVDAILFMLSNKEEAKRMGKEAAKLVSERFDLKVVVNGLERLYEEVISNHSCNRRC